MTRKPAEIVKVTQADERHHVLSTVSEFHHRNTPCDECPWRVDRTGNFPAEAFRISARTSYDQSPTAFACHMSKALGPVTCASFLMRGAERNAAVAGAVERDLLDMETITDDGIELHASYRAMAVANGVDPDDPVIADCP